jgi:hypothetical protein
MPGRSDVIGGRVGPGRSAPSCRAGIVAALGLVLAALPGAAPATPYIPTDDAQIVERLPQSGNTTLRQLRRLNEAVRQAPGNLDLALIVATRDHEAARAEADPRFDGYAEAALKPWLDLPDPPAPVLLLRATLRQSRHDFPAALADLDRVTAAMPRNPQAWLTRAVVLQVEGEHEQALASCAPLRRLAEKLVVVLCEANISSLGADAKTACAGLQQALDQPNANPALRLWALTVLGETAARLGDPVAAEQHFRAGLALGIDDAYLLGAFADFLLEQGRAEEVSSLLDAKKRIDPLMLRLTLAEAALDGPSLEADRADLAERFAATRLRGDRSHLREEARFTLVVLHRPEAALDLAQANWQVQHEPWDARLLLETALAAGRPDAARPALDWLARTGLDDVHLRPLVARLDGRSR